MDTDIAQKMSLETENSILKEALQHFARLISGEAHKADMTEYTIKGSDIHVAQHALRSTDNPCHEGLRKGEGVNASTNAK